MTSSREAREFAPCPTCKQYSHSIGEDRLAEAFNHFQSMFSHRGDGIPTQHSFDAKTRDAAQVLMTAASRTPSHEVVEAAIADARKGGWRDAMAFARAAGPKELIGRLQSMKPLIPNIYGPLIDQTCAALSSPQGEGVIHEAD